MDEQTEARKPAANAWRTEKGTAQRKKLALKSLRKGVTPDQIIREHREKYGVGIAKDELYRMKREIAAAVTPSKDAKAVRKAVKANGTTPHAADAKIRNTVDTFLRQMRADVIDGLIADLELIKQGEV